MVDFEESDMETLEQLLKENDVTTLKRKIIYNSSVRELENRLKEIEPVISALSFLKRVKARLVDFFS